MKTTIVRPNLNNFIKSLRDVGYTFEIAVADVLDNSISAGATQIDIHAIAKPELLFCMLDNGCGMTELELVEAMRLATKNPDLKREKHDLGRFGLGLKTASFSQCMKLTLISKKNNEINIKQWDLEYISLQNEWKLLTPEYSEYKHYPLVQNLENNQSGTLVIWEKFDRYEKESFAQRIDKLRKHLSLVFHRYLEGIPGSKKLKIFVNQSLLIPFDPFNKMNQFTREISTEKIKLFGSSIEITPYILPHHKNVSQQEWEEFGTEDGYIKSQGFYFYRGNRLLIYGTWWGLHKATDAHKLVRIKIDISNDQDIFWGIDIKKSTANPVPEIKQDLKRIIHEVVKEGIKPFIKRASSIKDKTITRFWNIIPDNNQIYFGINKEHPIYQTIINQISPETQFLFNSYLKSLEAFLPLPAIQSYQQQQPHQLKQDELMSEDEIKDLAHKLKEIGLSQEYIEKLLKTELFKDRKELLQ